MKKFDKTRHVLHLFILCYTCFYVAPLLAESWRGETAYHAKVKPRNGMLEKGYNRGAFIDSANRMYAYIEAPYCASGGSKDLNDLGATTPKVRSGRSRAFITPESVDAREVWKGRITVPIPSISVFTRKGGGHYAFNYKTSGDTLFTFEYNSTPDGRSGSWYNGVWSGYKVRLISQTCAPTNPNRITHFTPVTFANNQKGVIQ